MLRRMLMSALALIILLPVPLWLATWAPAPAQLVATADWSGPGGGISAIEVFPNGRRFVAISDRGHLFEGEITRDGDGALSSFTTDGPRILQDPLGHPFRHNNADSEGLALIGDEVMVSFEGTHRLSQHRLDGSFVKALRSSPDFHALVQNLSLEALAVEPDGTLLTYPESQAQDGPDGWSYKGGTWSPTTPLYRTPFFSRTGADVGPDGSLYILERAFLGIGFAARVYRFGPNGRELVMAAPLWRHGNLEGITVWEDPQGRTRLLLATDDNYQPLQRNHLVEYVLP